MCHKSVLHQSRRYSEGKKKEKVVNCEGLSAAFICSCVISEAREAFIKQFSLLEASTGRLFAQLHGITSALNCSLGVTKGGRTRTRTEESGKTDEGVCQSFSEAALVITRSQKQLQQATLELDNMVGRIASGPLPVCDSLSHLSVC